MVQSIVQGRRNAIANTSQGLPRLRRLIPPMSLGLLLGVLTLGGAAYANTITVNSLSDTGASGICVLRDAITAANTRTAVNGCAAGSGNDTIVFSSGLTGTIAIGSPLPDIVNTLTINGPAATPPAITLDGGGGSYRLMQVNAGATLNLDSLAFTDSGEGAISNDGTLTVTDSTFADNKLGGLEGGGAILSSGTLTVTGTTFTGNSTGAGGGGGAGGGAILSTSTLTVTNSTFAGNSATKQGGGGAIESVGTLTVTSSTFSSNSATEQGSGGGAIESIGTLTVTNSTFSGNSAPLGGGGAIISVAGVSTIINSSTFSGNSGPFGGAIYNGVKLTVINSTFSGNSAMEAGAAPSTMVYPVRRISKARLWRRRAAGIVSEPSPTAATTSPTTRPAASAPAPGPTARRWATTSIRIWIRPDSPTTAAPPKRSHCRRRARRSTRSRLPRAPFLPAA